MLGIRVGMRGTGVEMRGTRGENEWNQVIIFVHEWKWWINNVEGDKNKRKYAHLWKHSFDTLVWETITETNLNTDFYFQINKLKGKYAQYNCVSCYSVNVQKPSIGVLQKRCSTKTHQIYRRSPMQKSVFKQVA